jgi:hypothetical protein
METIIQNPNTHNNGRTTAGVIILIIGGLLLIDRLDLVFLPDWIFSWPMWLIGWGLYMGGKYKFRKPIWVVMIILGTAFLVSENIDRAENIVWPLVIVGTGVWLVLKHSKRPAAQYPLNDK